MNMFQKVKIENKYLYTVGTWLDLKSLSFLTLICLVLRDDHDLFLGVGYGSAIFFRIRINFFRVQIRLFFGSGSETPNVQMGAAGCSLLNP